MKYFEQLYNSILSESRNGAFVREMDELLQKWERIQSEIPGQIPTYKYSPNGEPYDPPDAGQKIQLKDLPVYQQNIKNPSERLLNTDHFSLRRVYYKQTEKEIDFEKEVLRVIKKYSNFDYLKNGFMYYHNFGYRAYAMGGPRNGAEQRKMYYLENEGTVFKDVLSCYGYDKEYLKKAEQKHFAGYGMIVKGWPIVVSGTDLASQTYRTATDEIKKFYKGSGVPKRPNFYSLHSAKDDNHIAFKNKINTRNGEPPLTQEEIHNLRNDVILDKGDGVFAGEALLDNWQIDGWYFSDIGNDGLPYPSEFWRNVFNKTKKPVYHIPINTIPNQIERVDLANYYS